MSIEDRATQADISQERRHLFISWLEEAGFMLQVGTLGEVYVDNVAETTDGELVLLPEGINVN